MQVDNKLDIRIDSVSKIIEDLDATITDLEGELGLDLINNTKNELNDNLSGEFKDAMLNTTDVVKEEYVESIMNVMALKKLMQRYKEFLEVGPTGKLVANKDYIQANPYLMNYDKNKMEEIISDKLHKVKDSEETFAWIIKRGEELRNLIRVGACQTPPDGCEEERRKLDILVKNEAILSDICATTNANLRLLEALIPNLETKIAILSGELDLYNSLWENYGIDEFRAKYYFIETRDEVIMNRIKDKLPDEIVEIIENFEKGYTLVVDFSLISDTLAQRMESTGFFVIDNINGKYRFDLKYDNITLWARNNGHIIDNIAEDAMKKGLSGIYKFDPKIGKYYNYDKKGNISYITELPDGFNKALNILGPLGYAVDTISIANAFESGELDEILGTTFRVGGSALGAWSAALLAGAVVDPVPGDAVVVFLAGMLGSFFGGAFGENLGKNIANLFDENLLVWEFNG